MSIYVWTFRLFVCPLTFFPTTSSRKPPFCSNFIWSSLRSGEQKIAKMVAVRWPRWPPCWYMVTRSIMKREDKRQRIADNCWHFFNNQPKYLIRMVLTNSADPDQPRFWSASSLFAVSTADMSVCFNIMSVTTVFMYVQTFGLLRWYVDAFNYVCYCRFHFLLCFSFLCV